MRNVGNVWRHPKNIKKWFYVKESFASAFTVTPIPPQFIGGRSLRRVLSQLSTNTIHAMTSDGGVRRPRTESERNRRRKMIGRILASKTHSTESPVAQKKQPTVGCMRRAHRAEGLRAFNARRGKRDIDRCFVTMSGVDSWRRRRHCYFITRTLSSRKDALCAVRDLLGIDYLSWTVNLANTAVKTFLQNDPQTNVLQTRRVRYSKATGPSATTATVIHIVRSESPEVWQGKSCIQLTAL